MAKITVRVDAKTGQNYFPRHVREDGFVGKVEGLTNAMTLVFIKPGTDLADVKESLSIMVRDIALRRRKEASRNPKREGNQGLPTRTTHKATTRQHALFIKYTRDWLHEVTGFSRGYLSRVATGKIPLSRSFIERICYTLQMPEAELFLAEATAEEDQ